jgi:hypothetical protein
MEHDKKKPEPEKMSDWEHHQLLVLSSLQRLEKKTDAIYEKQAMHDREIDRLKIKGGLLGMIAGALSGFGVKFFGG